MPSKKSAKKKPIRKTVKKRAAVKKPRLACVVCGMEITIDRMCGCAESHPIVCCGQPMRSK